MSAWPSRSTRRRLIGIAIATLLGGACSSASNPDDASSPTSDPNGVGSGKAVKIDVFLAGSKVELVRSTLGDTAADPAPQPGRELRWELHSTDGPLVAAGIVRDPRFLRAEFSANGEPVVGPDREPRGSVGIFSAHIPQVGGRLVVLEPDGSGFREIGQTDVPPPSSGDIGSSGQAILNPALDIIGEPVAVVMNGDPASKINILIVPDGYTEDQLGQFQQDVTNFVAGLQLVTGFRERWAAFNIWRQDVRSTESGIASLDTGAKPNTAFNLLRGSDDAAKMPQWPRRCVMLSPDIEAQAILALDAISAKVNADFKVILANDTEYGGCAAPWNQMATTTRNPDGPFVLAHELGHAIFNLGDEYGGNGYFNDGKCDTTVSLANITGDPNNLPWEGLRNTSQIPTPAGVLGYTVGAFEGAGLCDQGIYRPQQSCLMRATHADLCEVCAGEMDRIIRERDPAFQANKSNCSAACCDGSVRRGDEVDGNQCIFWIGSGCNPVGGPAEIRYNDASVWSAKSGCPSKASCSGVCCDGKGVAASDTFDTNVCALLAGTECEQHGGLENAYFGGTPAWSVQNNITCTILTPAGSNCAARCCDGTTADGGTQADPKQCVFWGGTACKSHGGPINVQLNGVEVWDNGATECSTLRSCEIVCKDGSVQVAGDTFDSNICTFFNASKCNNHGGMKCAKYAGGVVSGSCP